MSFARFLDPDLLEDIIGDARLREAVAKKVDHLLGEQATVVYGTVFSDGGADGWASTKSPIATHVGLLLAPRAMAALSKHNSYIKTDALTSSDMVRAQEAQIRALRSENEQLRRGDK